MAYITLTLPLPEKLFETIEPILSRQGALSITAEDASDTPIFEPQGGETILWKNLILKALFPANKNKQKIMNQLKPHLDPLLLVQALWQEVPEMEWEKAWLDHYHATQFGNKLWVGSIEHTPPINVQSVLFLEPGLAFGTGSHPTTYLCLESLAKTNLQDKTLIDYGCGSGILALAALKCGAKWVIGIDIDPQALEATQENARRNHISENSLSLGLPAFLHGEARQTADIVIANILANPLISLAEHLISLLCPGGSLILSGLLKEQEQMVQKAYAHAIDWGISTEKEGWICLSGKALTHGL